MKIFLALIILITLYTNTKAQDKMEKVNSVIQTVKEKFAPDKRTAVFNLEATESENKLTIKGVFIPEDRKKLNCCGLREGKNLIYF